MPLLTWFLRFAANGDLWLAAGVSAILLTLVDAAGLLDRRPLAARAAGLVFVLACAFGALSGTPLPLPLWVPLSLAAAFHGLRGFNHPRPLLRRTSAASFTITATLALAHEIPFLIGPLPPSGSPRTLVVLGDSLSAGGYGETRRWMQILAEDHGLDIRDLSRDGQTVVSALADAEHFFQEDHIHRDEGSGDAAWILIELGGNDVLGESTLADYTTALDRLLGLCRGEAPTGPPTGLRRTVVMLEIPGVPGRWGFAETQRRLAARHGVVLVPKRVLAGVVFACGSTSADALHLTQPGQQRLAEALRPWLGLASR